MSDNATTGAMASARTCARHRETLIDWVEGRLDEAAGAELAAHAAGCAECAGLARFYGALRGELQAAPCALPPELYFEGVLAQIHRAMPRPLPAPPRRRRIRREHAATTAMACMLLLCVLPLLRGALAGAGDALAGLRGAPSALASAAPPAVPATERRALLAARGIGIYSEDSPIWQMTPRQRRDLGLGFKADEVDDEAIQVAVIARSVPRPA